MKVKGFSDNKRSSVQALNVDEIRLQALLPVYKWGSRLLQADSEEEICNLVGDALQKEIGATSLSVMLLDESACCLRIVAARGLTEEVIDQSRVKSGEGISGLVFATKTPLVINRADKTPEEIQALLIRNELSSSVSFPLVSRNQSIGVINIGQHNGRRSFQGSDIELVSILAQLTVLAIENLRLHRQKQENVKIRTLFEQYVSPEVARILLDKGQPAVDSGTIQTLTVMFADIRNYTLLVQHLTIPDLRSFLDDFFKMFTRIVYANHGTLDKFMGDGALVIFGAPTVHENPAETAVKTSKEVVRAFRSLRSQLLNQDGVFARIGLGIGISCGEMFLGNLGSSERFDYTVVGPDVNIAQRLASRGEGDSVSCTDAVMEACRGESFALKAETMRLKGFARPITVHEIIVE